MYKSHERVVKKSDGLVVVVIIIRMRLQIFFQPPHRPMLIRVANGGGKINAAVIEMEDWFRQCGPTTTVLLLVPLFSWLAFNQIPPYSMLCEWRMMQSESEILRPVFGAWHNECCW
jgi:hypothetical protein